MQDFIELVYQMRELQKKYFRSRSQNVLQHCKRVEKEVDDYIANKLPKEPEEPSLF